VLTKVRDERIDRLRRHGAVGVHEQHDVAVAAGEPLVHGAREAEVLVVRDQLDVRPHRVRGVGVVDDHDVQAGRDERLEARVDRVRRAVGDDDRVGHQVVARRSRADAEAGAFRPSTAVR
jgi:hypothetical protein